MNTVPEQISHSSTGEGGSAFTQNDDSSFAGDVAFHKILHVTKQNRSADQDFRNAGWQSRKMPQANKNTEILFTLYIRFARKHSTSSISILELAPVLFPSLMAAANSATGILVRRRGDSPFFGSSKPPARKTLRQRLRKAISRPRSRVRYIRLLTNSFSPASIAASNPARSPCLMQRLRGRKSSPRRG